MKTCKQCGGSFPLSEFYVHHHMADGRLNLCKVCVRTRARKHRATSDSYRARTTGYKRTYALRHPEKRRAHGILWHAIMRGDIKQGNCWCGNKGEAHHQDYGKPLEVVWLCRQHHAALHLIERQEQR